ncbi:hypothetical protein Purlil1_3134 [Purpureocillium lilacinum]|uniref:Uncharacterized protein n=1 Tax=Purpureocillium lilacinum TaxID=33203 RepID=A0ABR0C988_PURLI|nr:hypothetical protein Purlil1_3134 [Purpureocillium lilacinum]GJN68968.1 hypothetical protein PLICBS_003014 [Purpureocillium lilacinum]
MKGILSVAMLLAFGAAALPNGLVVRSGLDGDLAYNKPASPERRSGLDGDLAYNKPASPERRSGLDGDLAYNKPASPE